MNKYNRIILDKEYIEALRKLEDKERERIYCRHGIEHCLDVARIAYILSLERGLNLDKDEVYAASLLHDIGRVKEGADHDKHSADMAEPVLRRSGYTKEEAENIINAVRGHREIEKASEPLTEVIAEADKLSRQCWCCNASESCYWKEEKKNNCIKY